MSRKRSRAKTRGRRSAHKRQPKRSGRRWLYLATPVVLVVVVGLIASMALNDGGASPGQVGSDTYPAYVLNAPLDVREAYGYAVERPDVLGYIPCYCGCGGHSGHTSVHDCFVRQEHLNGGTVSFDSHGSGCQMCVDIALYAKALLQSGNTLKEARQYVEARFGDIGPATDTPAVS